MRRDSIATALGGITAVAAAFSLSSQSCGIIDTGGVGGVTLGTPTLQITSPQEACHTEANGERQCKPACVVAQAGDIPYVPISIAVDNLQLEPPGVCGQVLTTVSVTGATGVGVGVGGNGGSGGSNTITLPCGHIAVTVCSRAAVVPVAKDNEFWKDDEHKHCPLQATPNNLGSGTEIDALLPDLRPPTPDMMFNELHVDLTLIREASFNGELIVPITVLPQGVDIDVVPPGGQCPNEGNGGAGGVGGMGGFGGTNGRGGSGGV